MKTHLTFNKSNKFAVVPACGSDRRDGRVCCAVSYKTFVTLDTDEQCKKCAKVAEQHAKLIAKESQ